MDFYNRQLFYIYNQGNNGEQLFYKEEHFKLFLWKMKASLLPFGRLISYCLMPNHFHWQFFIDHLTISKSQYYNHFDKIQFQQRVEKYGNQALPIKERQNQNEEFITINEAIGMIQRSYARVINKEFDRSGSLFRTHCKAKDGWISEFITVNGPKNEKFKIGNDYGFKCMEYIHDNPVVSGLVKNAEDWIYSSAKDYNSLRKDSFIDIELGMEIRNNI